MITYPLACSTWDNEELEAAIEVLKSGQLTMGKNVREFEKLFAKRFGAKYAVMVNSGSSANLLAISALMHTSPPKLKPGDEIIVPAVSWSTTYSPLYQHNLRLKFVDIDPETFNLNIAEVQKALTPQTKAVLAVNLLGAPNNFEELNQVCEEHSLLLIEDNCESMGAEINGKFCGTFGICGTFSLFFSHHICTMEGGVVLTDNEELYHIMLSMRAHGWTRELPDKNLVCNKTSDPFHEMYRFVLPGYNLRPLEISGAIGIKQLEKLDTLLVGRRQNANYFVEKFGNLDFIKIQHPIGNSSWFAFAMVLDGKLAGKRQEVVKNLLEAGVECRPIVAGNFTKNPVIRFFNCDICGELPNAQKLDRDGFYIGNHHLDLTNQLSITRDLIMECT